MRELLRLPDKAKFIWTQDNTRPDDKVIFRRRFTVSSELREIKALVFAETKYWLYINGRLAVFEGGLFRESRPGCGWADEVDLTPYLHEGENQLAVLVFYYGNEGRNNTDSGRAAFLFCCEALDLYSDERFLCRRHNGYYHVENSPASHLYGGWDLGIEAAGSDHDFFRTDAYEGEYSPACVYPNEVWGGLCRRPVPLLRQYAPVPLSLQRSGEEWTAALPYAMTFSPRLRLRAQGGEVLTLLTDRYTVNGGPGDHGNRYRGYRMEYRCRAGEQEFEPPAYLYGETLRIQGVQSVELLEAAAVESGYDCEQTGDFSCSCTLTNKLIQKSVRTLYVCMRDNFMDCPDRERGQWIGDTTVQVPQALLVYGEQGAALVKKAILDFILLRRGDVLMGNVPGANFSELPGQSLIAISEWGMIAEYVNLTGDDTVMAAAFEPVVRYLMLWDMDDTGRLLPRKGNWRWFDHLFNVDDTVLEHALYYSALGFAQRMAAYTGCTAYDDWLEQRREGIRTAFARDFWKGRYFTSGSHADDRANAIAVLAGLVPREAYAKIRMVLQSVCTGSIYMEYFILKALCEMGFVADAYRRMCSRYYNLAVNENSTLWEDFMILGSRNHAWSGAPLNIAFQYFAGIKTTDGFKTYTVNPAVGLFDSMDVSFTARGRRVKVTVCDESVHIEETPI